MSDLHLEFADIELPGDSEGILLLAGDITLAATMYVEGFGESGTIINARARRFFLEQCAKYKHVYYIMGNHEHYNGVWEHTENVLKHFLLESNNVTFLEKRIVEVDETTMMWGGTLWTNMDNHNPIVEFHAKRGMNDYELINMEHDGGIVGINYIPLHPQDTITEHEVTFKNLQECVAAHPDKKIIIMSHMAPSSKSSHPRYGTNNPLNHVYYSELSNYILDNPQIKVWCHGHTHDTHDYMIGDTRVVCNPRGYAKPMRPLEQENAKFDINFTFEV